MPQPRGPARPRFAAEDLVPRGARGPRRLQRDRDPLLARPVDARPDLPAPSRRVARGVRRRGLHRVHGAARPGAHGPRRQGLPEGDERLPARDRGGDLRARLSARPRGPRQARAAPRDGRLLRGPRPLRRTPRRARRRKGYDRARSRPPGRAAEDRRGLPARSRRGAARLPRGAPNVLVLPPRRHHRAERLGRLQPRPPRPAPPPVPPEGARRRDADGGICPRADRVLLREVQQPPGAAQGRHHGRRERHVHRLREHQPRRPPLRRLRRFERGDAPPPRHPRRDAPPPAVVQRPGLTEDAGDGPQARPQGR